MTPERGVDDLAERLRRAGSVFSEEEAEILRRAAGTDAELEQMADRRKAGEFLEHVVGIVEIAGSRLAVGPGAFVPRQRTRLLIDEATAAARESPRPIVVEAYCGVAPVAAVLARRVPAAQVHACDISEQALLYARQNLPPGAGVYRGEHLRALPEVLAGRLDVIAAVPPYVPTSALDLVTQEARDHEPSAARAAGEDGLDHVRALLAEAPAWLAPTGLLLMEMHQDQARQALTHAAEHGYRDRDIVPGDDGHTAVVRLRRRSYP